MKSFSLRSHDSPMGLRPEEKHNNAAQSLWEMKRSLCFLSVQFLLTPSGVQVLRETEHASHKHMCSCFLSQRGSSEETRLGFGELLCWSKERGEA